MTNTMVMSNQAPRDVDCVEGLPRVFINTDILTSINKHVQTDILNEVCGVLFGIPGKDTKGYFLHITHAIEGKYADQRGTSVTFTHDTWDYINKRLSEAGKNVVIVGWYHSHPSFGVFYSSHDTFIQEHFFGEPWQVGIVIDPTTNHQGVFVNLSNGIEGLHTYWSISETDEPAQPISCEYLDRIAAHDPEKVPIAPETEKQMQISSELHDIQNQLNIIESLAKRIVWWLMVCVMILSVATVSGITWIGYLYWTPARSVSATHEATPDLKNQTQDNKNRNQDSKLPKTKEQSRE